MTTHSTAPETASPHHTPTDRKHFSIDLSLELERQLELEASPPPTPSASIGDVLPKHESLDPHILAHIITQLRKSVEELTKERDDMVKLLDSATTREASLQDTLQLMTEKATDYEEELSAAKKKMREDEEAIALLRNKVEESRRGLMRLQTESRRQSVAPNSLDLSRAGIPAFGSPPSSKRASFTPLTGRANAHRRISSISVDGNGLSALHLADLNPSPNGQTTSFPESSSLLTAGLQSSRRSLFGKSSPPNPDVPLPPANASSLPEIEALRREIGSLKKDLSDTRVELAEANEAKEASDMCVKALREFIADNRVGEGIAGEANVRLPPPPPSTMPSGGDHDSDKKGAAANSGWGFKLWRADPPRAPSVTTNNPQTPPLTLVQQPQNSAPLSRKLGGFFGSRASISSTTSQISSTAPVLQTNAVIPTQTANAPNAFQDSVSRHSVSDESSLVEPISPSYEGQGNVRIAGEGLGVPSTDKESDIGVSVSVQSVDDVRLGAIAG